MIEQTIRYIFIFFFQFGSHLLSVWTTEYWGQEIAKLIFLLFQPTIKYGGF